MRPREHSMMRCMGWMGARGAVLLAALLMASQARAADKPKATEKPKAAEVKAAEPKATEPKATGAKVPEPPGYGTAKFGMTIAEVWKKYPKATMLGEEEQIGAPVVDGPYIDRLLLRDMPAPNFPKPTNVELRFWKGHLWTVIIYFDDNDLEKCKAALAANFGPPTQSGDPDNPMWTGEKVTTAASYTDKFYGISDNALSSQARAWFGDMIKGVWKGETPEEKAEREKRMAVLTPKAGKAAATTPTPATTPSAK